MLLNTTTDELNKLTADCVTEELNDWLRDCGTEELAVMLCVAKTLKRASRQSAATPT